MTKQRNWNPNWKLTDAQVAEIVQKRAQGVRVIALAEEYGVTRTAIYNLLAQQVKKAGRQEGGRTMRKSVSFGEHGIVTFSFCGDIFKLTDEEMDLLRAIDEIMDYYSSSHP